MSSISCRVCLFRHIYCYSVYHISCLHVACICIANLLSYEMSSIMAAYQRTGTKTTPESSSRLCKVSQKFSLFLIHSQRLFWIGFIVVANLCRLELCIAYILQIASIWTISHSVYLHWFNSLCIIYHLLFPYYRYSSLSLSSGHGTVIKSTFCF